MNNERDAARFGLGDNSLDELLRSAQWPDAASDPLDRLLRLAEWPEPAKLSWKEVLRIGQRRKRKRIFAVVGAAAAAVLLAAVAIWTARGLRDKSSSKVAETAAGKAIAPQSVSPAGDNPKSVSQPLPPREVRLRVILEQIREKTAADDVKLNRIIARRMAEPDGDLEGLVGPLVARRSEFEQRLLERFSTFLGERESAAIELLGYLGSETSLPLLSRERLKPSTHAAAVRALLNLADSETLAQLERQEWDAGLRQEIAAVLQSRDDRQTTASTRIFKKGDQSCLLFQEESSSRSELF